MYEGEEQIKMINNEIYIYLEYNNNRQSLIVTY